MMQNLEEHDFEMVDFGYGFQSQSPPSKELHRLILDEKLIHGGNPALRWMLENVCIESDPAGNIKPSKKKSSEKIDGVVATIMALDGALKREAEKHGKGGIVIYDNDTGIVTRNGEVIFQPDPTEQSTPPARKGTTWAELEDSW